MSNTYQLNVKGDISSLGTALTQYIRSMCAGVTKCRVTVRRDVLDSGDGPSTE